MAVAVTPYLLVAMCDGRLDNLLLPFSGSLERYVTSGLEIMFILLLPNYMLSVRNETAPS